MDVAVIFSSIALALFAAIALGSTRLFGVADTPPDHAKKRVSTIDGLRGFLALAVVIHHNLSYSNWMRTGDWGSPGPLTVWLGQGGVALFFMITAYLFWGRLVRHSGQNDWLRFFVGRIFRIGPVYLLSAILTLFFIAITTNHLSVPWQVLVAQVLRWMSLGVFLPSEINNAGGLILSVTWTLHYEWLFYIVLVGLSILARTSWVSLSAATLALFLPLCGAAAIRYGAVHDYFIYAALFGSGMLTASLIHSGYVFGGSDRITSSIAVILLVGVIATTERANAVKPVLALTIIFYLIASGTTIFGTLTTRVAHRLGHISYGTYLLHATILVSVFGLAQGWPSTSSAAELSVHTTVVSISLVAALAAHRWVELPGIRLGDRVLTSIRNQMRLHLIK